MSACRISAMPPKVVFRPVSADRSARSRTDPQIAREQVNVQVRNGVAVDFIAHYGGACLEQCPRHGLNVVHECCTFVERQIVQIDGVALVEYAQLPGSAGAWLPVRHCQSGGLQLTDDIAGCPSRQIGQPSPPAVPAIAHLPTEPRSSLPRYLRRSPRGGTPRQRLNAAVLLLLAASAGNVAAGPQIRHPPSGTVNTALTISAYIANVP